MAKETFQLSIDKDIINKLTALVHTASLCKCQVIVSTDKDQVCADSVLGLLALWGDSKEKTITVLADGVDEQETIREITKIFNIL